LEYLSFELDKGKDVEWNMTWLKNILKFQEPTLRKYKEVGHAGRALMLRIYSSLAFQDQAIKKVANENIHLMKYMIKTAAVKKQMQEEPST
jgi:hypothetical protein